MEQSDESDVTVGTAHIQNVTSHRNNSYAAPLGYNSTPIRVPSNVQVRVRVSVRFYLFFSYKSLQTYM